MYKYLYEEECYFIEIGIKLFEIFKVSGKCFLEKDCFFKNWKVMVFFVFGKKIGNFSWKRVGIFVWKKLFLFCCEIGLMLCLLIDEMFRWFSFE